MSSRCRLRQRSGSRWANPNRSRESESVPSSSGYAYLLTVPRAGCYRAAWPLFLNAPRWRARDHAGEVLGQESGDLGAGQVVFGDLHPGFISLSGPLGTLAARAQKLHHGRMTTIGFIGSGNIGSQVARLAIASGYDVVMSNSRGPETLADLVAELGPRARAATPFDAAQAGDLVVVSVPLKNYTAVPVEPLAGKIVIDTNNYYPERDGKIPELDDESTTTAELLQAHLPTSKVVKAFNHIYASQLTTDGRPAGSPKRRALVIAGDHAVAKKSVTHLLDQFGFDTVDAGPLSEGWRIQRDTPGYGPRRTAEELRKDLAAAKRYRDQ